MLCQNDTDYLSIYDYIDITLEMEYTKCHQNRKQTKLFLLIVFY